MRFSIHTLLRLGSLGVFMVLATSPCSGHGGYHQEIQRCDEQIAAEPDNAAHWFRRARLDYLHGDWMRSLKDLETADRLAPGKYPVDLARGQAWMAGDKLPQARKALDTFVKSHPEVAEGFATRARLMMELDEPAAAVADFRQVLVKTNSPEPDLYLETADALVAAKHPREAIETLDAGMKKLGAITSLAGKALAIELSLGSYDLALSRVDALRRSAPRPEPWMAKRAAILAQAGRIENSQAAWIELRQHLLSLPENERGSHSMNVVLNQTRAALDSLSHMEPNAPN